MTTTNSQRIACLMAAHEAMVPYWKDGAFNDAPAALASEYADTCSLVDSALHRLSTSQQAAIRGGNACAIYGIKGVKQ